MLARACICYFDIPYIKLIIILSYLNANSHHKVHGLWTVVYPYLQSYSTSFSYLLQLTENVPRNINI